MTPPGSVASPRQRPAALLLPILSGLLILAAGVLPWTVLARLNAQVRPDLPWAALVTALYLALLLAWLNGAGPPSRSRAARRGRLRLWPPRPAEAAAPREAGALGTGGILALFALLYLLWIASGWLTPVPDLAAYPTTAFRWSIFLMGGVISGVVEEAAFRGYMQTGLERSDPERAVLITSLVFVAAHAVDGLGTLLLMAPGLFVASLLYGTLARRTGTILPGMVVHVLGDLSYTYFGILRGDGSLLFVAGL